MSDFDLEPPAMPGSKPAVKRTSFLKRIFHKDDDPADGSAGIADMSAQSERPSSQASPSSAATLSGPLSLEAPSPEGKPDLDEIKRKLGLEETEEPLLPTREEVRAEQTIPSPMPKQRIAIDDWSADTASTSAPAAMPSSGPWDAAIDTPRDGATDSEGRSSWTADPHSTDGIDHRRQDAALSSSSAKSEPHDLIDQHLAELDKAHAQILKKLESVAADAPQIPEWKLQEREVLPEEYFILRNGQTVKSLAELAEAIEYIDDSTFEHHVTEYRNDFANWIRDVIGDKDLADAVQAAESKAGVLRELLAHKRQAAKQIVKGHEKLKEIIRNRQAAVKKLSTVEGSVAELQRTLATKTKELQGERHRNAKLLKEKVSKEIEQRLAREKEAFERSKADLVKAKRTYHQGAEEYQKLVQSLEERERNIAETEKKAKAMLDAAKKEQEETLTSLKEAKAVVAEAAGAHAQIAELKRLEAQTKQHLDTISKQETALSRREETLRQREKKIADDLTRVKQEQERLATLKTEHAKREAAVKKLEADAKKLAADSDRRIADAVTVERDTKARIKAETAKLEALRKQVDKTLGKALGQKKKLTTAIALRKQLTESMQTVKKETASERKQLEEEGFQSYIRSTDATTGAGQPAIVPQEDERMAKGKNALIYQRIEECRLAIERNDMVGARRLYNELRELYAKADIPASEKSAVYTSIRELYDDIHLAMLN